MGTKENLPLKKALVTGGGGFVGKAIVKRLASSGVETRVIGRNNYPDLEAAGVECIVGSITDPAAMARAVEGVEVVFHVAALAGIWGPWKDYYSTNVLGTSSVLSACKNAKVPSLVYTSTPSVVFNREDIEEGSEDLEYASRFLCHYAKSKVIAEKMVLQAASTQLKTCAIRPHLIWGPGDPHLLPRILESGRQGLLKRVGTGHNFVDISYIDNVAEAHILAAKNLQTSGSANGNAYFIGQDKPVNLWNWIDDLFIRMGVDTIEKSVPFTTAYKVGWILEKIYLLLRIQQEPRMTRFLAEQLAKSHYFSKDRARKDLSYKEIVSTEEGLRRTVEWLKNR